MNEVLKINYETEQPTVSARELHEALGVASRFSRWFDSNKELFVEGEDYNKCTSSTVVNNGANILQSMQYEKWKDRIPDNYYIQVLHYLLVTGWQFVVLRAHLNTDWGNEKRTTVKHYFIERRDVEADLTMLQQEEEKFWRYVESGRKPPLILPEI